MKIIQTLPLLAGLMIVSGASAAVVPAAPQAVLEAITGRQTVDTLVVAERRPGGGKIIKCFPRHRWSTKRGYYPPGCGGA